MVKPRCVLFQKKKKRRNQRFTGTPMNYSYCLRAHSLGKTLMLGKTEGRKRGQQKDEMVGWHH